MIGEHVLRHAGGNLIDTPDQPLLHRPAGTDIWRYVATLWPDLYQPDGWAAQFWLPGERGWHLPRTLAVGDVVEFGLVVHAERRTVAEDRWWGWVDHTTERALLVHGRYEHPAHAHREAQRLVDEVRLAQLAAPSVGCAQDPVIDPLR